MGEKRKRSEKGKEKAERTSDKDHSSDKELLFKKVKVAKVVTEDTPPPVAESVEGETQQPGEVEVLVGMSVTLREESPEVIDMQRSWIEGPKGKKVSERGSENFG